MDALIKKVNKDLSKGKKDVTVLMKADKAQDKLVDSCKSKMKMKGKK